MSRTSSLLPFLFLPLWAPASTCTMTGVAGGGEGGGAGGGADKGAGGAAAGGEGGGGGEAGNDGAGGGTKAPATWRDGLAPELRNNPALKDFDDVAKLAAAHVELQGVIGKKGLVPPDPKTAKPEDWQRWRQGLPGVPKDAASYDLGDFKAPEGLPWDGEAQGKFLEVAHRFGVPSDGARALLDFYAEFTQQSVSQLVERTEADAKALREEWGGGYDGKIEAANAALRAAANGDKDELAALTQIKTADGRFLLDHPAMARLFARLGEDFGVGREDTGGLPGRGSSAGISTPAAAKAEIARIRGEAASDKEHPLRNKRHPEHDIMQRRLLQLYEIEAQDSAS